LFFEIGRAVDEPSGQRGIGGGLRHLEQRSGCFTGMVTVVRHGTKKIPGSDVAYPKSHDANAAEFVPRDVHKKFTDGKVPRPYSEATLCSPLFEALESANLSGARRRLSG
jgi:hypothetical protein